MRLEGPDGAWISALGISLLLLGAAFGLLWQALRGARGDLPRPWVARGLWLGLFALLGLGLNLSSLRWAQAERPQAEEASTVEVVAWTWNYRIVPRSVPADTPVVFRVSSLDTLHSFGVYDSHGRLLFTVMAMPGHEERLRFRFTEPGRYTVRCLEYCGVGHGRMVTEFLVERRK